MWDKLDPKRLMVPLAVALIPTSMLLGIMWSKVSVAETCAKENEKQILVMKYEQQYTRKSLDDIKDDLKVINSKLDKLRKENISD